MRIMQQISAVLSIAAVSVAMLWPAAVSAQHGHSDGASFEPLKTPNRAMAAYYQENLADIKKLTEAVQNQQVAEVDRVKALSELRRKYPDPAVRAATELIADEATKLAALAAVIIADAGVMMDHKMPPHAQSTPAAAYAMAKHNAVFTALRAAAADRRKEVHAPAAELLAAQSDHVGLATIAQGVDSGAYSELEAVNYFGLADASKSSTYLAKYLDAEKPDVQAAAASYLSYSPKYAARVRDEIVLNPKAKTEIRQAAAKWLARDPQVALPLLNDPSTPPALYGTALRSYVKASGPKLSPAQLQSLLRGIEGHEHANDDALKGVKEQIQQFYDSKSK